jgi:thiosulfate/3-mercaptopyruvate sulfurtransferase
VVVYDDGKGTLAARAWWVLRWAGLKDVAILDGGVLAWRAAGGALTFEAGLARRGGATLSGGHLKQIDAAEALAIARNGHLFDGRGRDAYEGQPGQPKTGHIPGAYSLPAGALQDSDGRLKPPEALRDWLAGQGLADLPPDGVAAYCGAGSAASYVVAALQTVGVDAALFPGSWTEWVKDPARPIAQGAGRG